MGWCSVLVWVCCSKNKNQRIDIKIRIFLSLTPIWKVGVSLILSNCCVIFFWTRSSELKSLWAVVRDDEFDFILSLLITEWMMWIRFCSTTASSVVYGTRNQNRSAEEIGEMEKLGFMILGALRGVNGVPIWLCCSRDEKNETGRTLVGLPICCCCCSSSSSWDGEGEL